MATEGVGTEEIRKVYGKVLRCILGGGMGGRIGDMNPADLPRAFLVALCGEARSSRDALAYLKGMEEDRELGEVALFFRKALPVLLEELAGLYRKEGGRIEKVLTAFSDSPQEPWEVIWEIFHPEAAGVMADREGAIKELRERRKIRLSRLNPRPIKDVPGEILFTANAIVTLPPADKGLDSLYIDPSLKARLEKVMDEEQIYWYDHPVQIGVRPENNEILYGLKGLAEAFRYEKGRGNADRDAVLTCVLSLSVTHKGLRSIADVYVRSLLEELSIPDLALYLFTEAYTERLLDEVLIPAGKIYVEGGDPYILTHVFGVDGR